jgi:hypothetical protein
MSRWDGRVGWLRVEGSMVEGSTLACSLLLFPAADGCAHFHRLLSIQSSLMKFTFAAALFAVASGAAPAEAHSSPKLLPGHLRGGGNLEFYARRLSDYPDEYDSRGCLPGVFKDKCAKCMCLEGGERNALQKKHCDLSAPGDGTDHCVPKGAPGSKCTWNWQCQSSECQSSSALCNGDCHSRCSPLKP